MKPVFVISCPIDTLSVDMEHVLEILVKAIIKTDKYDVKILTTTLGCYTLGFY
jgi:hypothetical protein